MILLAMIGHGEAAGNWAVLGERPGDDITAISVEDTAQLARLIRETVAEGGEAVLRGTGGRLLGRWPGGPKVGEGNE